MAFYISLQFLPLKSFTNIATQTLIQLHITTYSAPRLPPRMNLLWGGFGSKGQVSSFEFSFFSPFALLHHFRDSFASKAIINEYDVTSLVFLSPLYSPRGNALNPLFLNYIGKSLSMIFSIFIAFQIIQLFRSKTFSNRSSVGISWSQFVRVVLVVTQLVLLLGLFYLVGNDEIIYDIVATSLAAVLHLVEYKKSTVAVASLLFFGSSRHYFKLSWWFRILFQSTISS